MKTSYSALPMVAMLITFNAAADGVGQDRIPELQRGPATLPKSVTLTGCVAGGAEPGTYTLTNVTKAGEVAAKDTERSETVVLISTDVEISKHLNHMVSVTGSERLGRRVTGTTGTEKPAASETREAGDKKATATFTVTSLKMVADSCAKPAL